MSKNSKRIRIKSNKPQSLDFNKAMQKFADAFMSAERYITPLVLSTNMSPREAVILLACYGDAILSGTANSKSHSMSEDDIIGATNLLLKLWKAGLFVPSPNYPYTLQQTLKDGSEDEA